MRVRTRCKLRRLCGGEVLCTRHFAVFQSNDHAALSIHAKGNGRLLFFFNNLVSISVKECERIMAKAKYIDDQTWRVLLPLRQLMLEEKQVPLPFCPEPVSVVVCSVCLHHDEKGWIGKSSSFQNHKRKKHPDALAIGVKGQKVSLC